MKIRWWIALLLLLNVITMAWQWDAFARWGWGPNVQREPERLQQQIKPEALQFTLPGQAASAPAPSSASSPSPAAPASEAAAAPAGKAPEVLPAKSTPAAVVPSAAGVAPVNTAPATATQAKPASN
ncbi:hypothetical protein B9Z38_08370 [Limnohabitans sp. MMS-10A-160]|uniref:hypothetical protein n=1 Tax=unclassified Limnohabitans TaxID=2626134 RepID=UPI000D339327|nr:MULTISPECIES: hypothetical protein [unclassified Limnohabitans]PUE20599.1 hypothetical protein B9Z43_05890 [Limnohabitans sp. MMS-10A-192]PUE25013.1 hypothetical protein B9Z38_08370 [Limnohabitans sp. MMS-10A-160]